MALHVHVHVAAPDSTSDISPPDASSDVTADAPALDATADISSPTPAWYCGSGINAYSVLNDNIGVATYSSCLRVGENALEQEAYWISEPANQLRGAAVCCSP